MLAEESLSQKFVKKGFWLYAFTFVWAPIGYIIKISLSRDLSVDDLGLFYGIISFLTLISACNDLWATESLNYFLPRYLINKEYSKVKYLLRFVFMLQIITSIIIIWAFFVFGDFIAIHHFHNPKAAELLHIFALFFVGMNMMHICTSLFSASQDTKLQKATDFVRMLATMIWTLFLFFSNSGNIYLYAQIWIIGVLIGVAFALYFFYKNYYRPYLQSVPLEPDITLRKQFIKYAIPTFLTANIGIILSQIDSQIIISMLGNTANGYYSNYLSIMNIPFIILTPLISFLFPVFTELHARGNTQKMRTVFFHMNTLMTIIGIWIVVFMWQNSILLAQIFFWNSYSVSWEILRYSIPFILFNLLNQINFQLLAWTGQAWARTFSFGVVLPINIVLNIYLIKNFWVHGSALAVWISWIPLFLLTSYFTRSYYKIPELRWIGINIVLAWLAFFIGNYLFKMQWGNLNTMLLLGSSVCIYSIIFLWANIWELKKLYTIIKTNR